VSHGSSRPETNENDDCDSKQDSYRVLVQQMAHQLLHDCLPMLVVLDRLPYRVSTGNVGMPIL
jgi:hypothetical protein